MVSGKSIASSDSDFFADNLSLKFSAYLIFFTVILSKCSAFLNVFYRFFWSDYVTKSPVVNSAFSSDSQLEVSSVVQCFVNELVCGASYLISSKILTFGMNDKEARVSN